MILPLVMSVRVGYHLKGSRQRDVDTNVQLGLCEQCATFLNV
jgi:hypothetical protein